MTGLTGGGYLERVTIKGYGVEADWDGETLTARGTNFAGRAALNGKDYEQDVVVPREEIATIEHKRANPLVNGNLKVTTVAGKTYQLHYRRKSQADFDALAAQLQAATA